MNTVDLSNFLEGPWKVVIWTDCFERVWVRAYGDATLYDSVDEPMPYMLEVHGSLKVCTSMNRCPHIKAAVIDLTEASADTVQASELVALQKLTVARKQFVHLTKRTRMCNEIILV